MAEACTAVCAAEACAAQVAHAFAELEACEPASRRLPALPPALRGALECLGLAPPADADADDAAGGGSFRESDFVRWSVEFQPRVPVVALLPPPSQAAVEPAAGPSPGGPLALVLGGSELHRPAREAADPAPAPASRSTLSAAEHVCWLAAMARGLVLPDCSVLCPQTDTAYPELSRLSALIWAEQAAYKRALALAAPLALHAALPPAVAAEAAGRARAQAAAALRQHGEAATFASLPDSLPLLDARALLASTRPARLRHVRTLLSRGSVAWGREPDRASELASLSLAVALAAPPELRWTPPLSSDERASSEAAGAGAEVLLCPSSFAALLEALDAQAQSGSHSYFQNEPGGPNLPGGQEPGRQIQPEGAVQAGGQPGGQAG
ncbi:hypothetical protein T492DRAFT_913309, partial [Pavlovales sp. CCMP2436]